MKAIVMAGLIVLAALISGCTTTQHPGEPVPPVPEIPDLVGNWSGPMYGYEEGTGYTTFSSEIMTMKVTEQHDRVFAGVITFSNRVESWADQAFAGVIDRDGRTLTIVEEYGGSSTGVLLSPGEIELTYIDTGEPFSIAVDVLKKE